MAPMKHLWPIPLCLLALLAACHSAPPPPQDTPAPDVVVILTAQPPRVLTPTTTRRPTRTPSPTPTLDVPVPTALAVPGTPMPAPGAAIATENVDRLVPLARLDRGQLHAVAWTAGGAQICTSSSAGLTTYDTNTYTVMDFKPILAGGACADLARDGTRLATCNTAPNGENYVTLYEAAVGPLALLHSPSPLRDAVLSPDGLHLAAQTEAHGMALWDFYTYAQVATLPASRCASFSLDGKLLIAEPYDRPRTFQVWRTADGTLANEIGVSSGSDCSFFTPDGTAFVRHNGSDTLEFRRISDGAIVAAWPAPDSGIRNLVYSPDEQLLAGSGEIGVRLWRASDGTLLHTLAMTAPGDLAFSPDSHSLAAASSAGALRVWDVTEGTLIYAADDYAGSWSQIDGASLAAFTPDGQYLATFEEGTNSISLWQVAGAALVWAERSTPRLQPEMLLAAPYGPVLWRPYAGTLHAWEPDATMPDAQFLQPLDATLRLWQPGAAEPVRALTWDWQAWRVTAIILSPDGGTLAGINAPDGTIEFRQTSDGRILRTLSGYAHLSALLFAPDGNAMALRYDDGTLEIRHPTGGMAVQIAHGAGAPLAFSPDGRWLAVRAHADPAAILLWNRDTNAHYTVHTAHSYAQVAFSPDNALFAVATGNAVEIWRTAGGALLRALDVPTATGVAFSADGQLLATVGTDGSVRVWGVR